MLQMLLGKTIARKSSTIIATIALSLVMAVNGSGNDLEPKSSCSIRRTTARTF